MNPSDSQSEDDLFLAYGAELPPEQGYDDAGYGATNGYEDAQGYGQNAGFTGLTHSPEGYTMPYTGGRAQQHSKPNFNSRDYYWRDEMPYMREKRVGSNTYNVPALAPNKEPNVTIKTQIFETAQSEIKNGPGDWKEKATLLENIFREQVPGARNDVAFVMAQLNALDKPAFKFTAPTKVLDQNAQPLDIGQAGALAADATDFAEYFEMQLKVDPKAVELHAETPFDKHLFPPASQTKIFMIAPKGNDDKLSPEITRDHLSGTEEQRKSILEAIKAAGGEPSPLMLGTYSSTPTRKEFDKWLEEIRHETRFIALMQVIKEAYVGDSTGLESLSQRLIKVKHWTYDAVAKKPKLRSMSKLSKVFDTILREVNNEDPPIDIPDLAKTFFGALPDNIKKKVVKRLPVGAPNNYEENLNKLHECVAVCQEAEDELLLVIRQVQATSGW